MYGTKTSLKRIGAPELRSSSQIAKRVNYVKLNSMCLNQRNLRQVGLAVTRLLSD